MHFSKLFKDATHLANQSGILLPKRRMASRSVYTTAADGIFSDAEYQASNNRLAKLRRPENSYRSEMISESSILLCHHNCTYSLAIHTTFGPADILSLIESSLWQEELRRRETSQTTTIKYRNLQRPGLFTYQ